jgi:oligoribonuclease
MRRKLAQGSGQAVKDPQNLVWIDLEMTGLDPENDRILEIATVVTNKDLRVLAEGPVVVIHQPDKILAGMDEWNTVQHGDSGLITRVRESTDNEAEAQARTLLFLNRYTEPGKSPMCGNSICQDRRFLARYMPRLERFFHYRNLDVSSLKELVMRWAPALEKGFSKEARHLALADIHESIKELEYYRANFIGPEYRIPVQ